MGAYNEARLGSLIAAGGVIWAADISTAGFHNMNSLFPMPAGPLEVCALGILIWLHAKWRGSVKLK